MPKTKIITAIIGSNATKAMVPPIILVSIEQISGIIEVVLETITPVSEVKRFKISPEWYCEIKEYFFHQILYLLYHTSSHQMQ